MVDFLPAFFAAAFEAGFLGMGACFPCDGFQ